MPSVYLAGDVVVQISDDEGTQLALIEAQAASLSLVATGVGGVASAGVDRETGRITALGDDVAMPDAISTMSTIQQHCGECGERGRRHVMTSSGSAG
jgi:colanic acid/amylovoran biosynthesis glycosyltransferase